MLFSAVGSERVHVSEGLRSSSEFRHKQPIIICSVTDICLMTTLFWMHWVPYKETFIIIFNLAYCRLWHFRERVSKSDFPNLTNISQISCCHNKCHRFIKMCSSWYFIIGTVGITKITIWNYMFYSNVFQKWQTWISFLLYDGIETEKNCMLQLSIIWE